MLIEQSNYILIKHRLYELSGGVNHGTTYKYMTSNNIDVNAVSFRFMVMLTAITYILSLSSALNTRRGKNKLHWEKKN